MELHEMTDSNIDYILANLDEDNDTNLSEWEREVFIPSIRIQWKHKRKLSDRQKEILGQIHDKAK